MYIADEIIRLVLQIWTETWHIKSYCGAPLLVNVYIPNFASETQHQCDVPVA